MFSYNNLLNKSFYEVLIKSVFKNNMASKGLVTVCKIIYCLTFSTVTICILSIKDFSRVVLENP